MLDSVMVMTAEAAFYKYQINGNYAFFTQGKSAKKE